MAKVLCTSKNRIYKMGETSKLDVLRRWLQHRADLSKVRRDHALVTCKSSRLLFEVLDEVIVNWHHRTPFREHRRVKMCEWKHKHRLQRYWNSVAPGHAILGCLGTHVRVLSMTS